MKRSTLQWLALALCLLLLAACQAGGPAACSSGDALFADDFSGNPNCGWITYERSGASAAVTGDGLVLTTNQPGQIWWTNPGRSFADTIITVTAEAQSGPDDNAFGIICRYQDTQNYYVFLISSDGYYAIGRYDSSSNQVTYLSGGGAYSASEVINQGNSRNDIRASCVGNQLSLAVNGIEIDSVTDSAFTTGDIGLAASTFQPGTLRVRFDDLRVVRP